MPESTLPAISGVSDRQLSLLDLPSLPELEACIRCGLCLSVCPTYRPTQVETKSPRGRIALVKNLVEGGIDLTDRDFSRHMDLCLQCMACHTVCPTDVNAGEVVARAKSYMRATNDQGRISRALRGILYTGIFPNYRRMELVTLPTRLYNRSGLQRLARRTGLTHLLPTPLRRMEELLPSRSARPLRPRLPRRTKARGEERARVAFHLTCVNNVVLP
ncbi:MAG: 4Fe-4S dicluster domain-containing protein [Chloroflexota bacterium]